MKNILNKGTKMENDTQNYVGVPQEIKKWNWGAFMMNIIWGLGNKSYLPLLCLIPIFNIVWVFVCGVKGNEWAWKKGNYSSVQEFMQVQDTWNRAGIFQFIITIVVVVLYFALFASIMSAMASSFYY